MMCYIENLPNMNFKHYFITHILLYHIHNLYYQYMILSYYFHNTLRIQFN